MGCAQSSSGRPRSRSADEGKKPSCTPTSHTSANSLLRERAITVRAADGVAGGDQRQQQEEEKQRGGRSSPEADLPINWNLRFKDLIVLEHIANG